MDRENGRRRERNKNRANYHIINFAFFFFFPFPKARNPHIPIRSKSQRGTLFSASFLFFRAHPAKTLCDAAQPYVIQRTTTSVGWKSLWGVCGFCFGSLSVCVCVLFFKSPFWLLSSTVVILGTRSTVTRLMLAVCVPPSTAVMVLAVGLEAFSCQPSSLLASAERRVRYCSLIKNKIKRNSS